jgi:starch synthase
MEKLNILFVTTELRGLVSIGGLSEFVMSLSCELQDRGHDVRIIMPYYEYINKKHKISGRELIWKGKLDGHFPEAEIFVAELPENSHHITLYLVKGHPHFSKADRIENIYTALEDPGPYFFLAAAILRFLSDRHLYWCPDVIHCNDYHAGG